MKSRQLVEPLLISSYIKLTSLRCVINLEGGPIIPVIAIKNCLEERETETLKRKETVVY